MGQCSLRFERNQSVRLETAVQFQRGDFLRRARFPSARRYLVTNITTRRDRGYDRSDKNRANVHHNGRPGQTRIVGRAEDNALQRAASWLRCFPPAQFRPTAQSQHFLAHQHGRLRLTVQYRLAPDSLGSHLICLRQLPDVR